MEMVEWAQLSGSRLSLLSLETLFAKGNATMIRLLNQLADFQFDIQHLAGKANNTADFLSRYIYKKRESHKQTQTRLVRDTDAHVNLVYKYRVRL